MKYLITTQQIDDIKTTLRWLCHGEVPPVGQRVMTSANVLNALDSLKPIEPLTSQSITEIWESEAIKGTRFGYGPFARAIEQRVLGDAS